MKYLLIICTGLLVLSCNTDTPDQEINPTTVADLFLQKTTPNLDQKLKGLYDGVIGTFDQSIHGEIVVSIYNDGYLTAGAKLLDGSKLRFEGAQIGENNYRFKNEMGSFEVQITEEREIKAYNVNFNDQDGFVSVFKNTRGVGTVLAFGTYVDSLDPSFSGVFDMLSIDGEIDPAVPPFGLAFRIQDVFVSHIGGQTSLDADAFNYEPFTQCVFTTLPMTMRWSSGDISVLEALNQSSSFFGYDASWGLFYGNNSGAITYYDNTCTVATSGSWSWNGRSGSISIIMVN
ncbi:MAG: hypothetical protein ABJM06_08115 [Gilvibacter sp.]